MQSGYADAIQQFGTADNLTPSKFVQDMIKVGFEAAELQAKNAEHCETIAELQAKIAELEAKQSKGKK